MPESWLRRLPNPTSIWQGVELPALIDYRDGNHLIEVTVDLVAGRPAITRAVFNTPDGADTVRLQRDLRWASPLEVITHLAPRLLKAQIDPYSQPLPTEGFPRVAISLEKRELSDEFLAVIAREYLTRGRGYAGDLARLYVVSPRTVNSWVAQARKRGILTPPPKKGKVGGALNTRGSSAIHQT